MPTRNSAVTPMDDSARQISGLQHELEAVEHQLDEAKRNMVLWMKYYAGSAATLEKIRRASHQKTPRTLMQFAVMVTEIQSLAEEELDDTALGTLVQQIIDVLLSKWGPSSDETTNRARVRRWLLAQRRRVADLVLAVGVHDDNAHHSRQHGSHPVV